MRATDDVLFRVAGGPRVGFGHVMRSLSLARALGVQARLSLRGGETARRTARVLGARLDVCRFPHQLDPARTRVLVVDDPSARAVRPWVRAARRRGIGSVSVHDLGIAPVSADLAIDGSVVPGRHETAGRALLGLRYTVLDPRLAELRKARRTGRSRREANPPRIVVSLGGGGRAALAMRLARAIRAAAPAADVRVAGGFVAGARTDAAGVRAIAPTDFRRELAQATAAVVAGGVSLYEACALGVPTVALSVVPGQSATVKAFGRRGVSIDGGPVVASEHGRASRIAAQVARTMATLLADPQVRERLARRASREVDGRGAERVARAILALRDGVRARR